MELQRKNVYTAFIFCVMMIAIIHCNIMDINAQKKDGTYYLNESKLKMEQGGSYKLFVSVVSSGSIEMADHVKWFSNNKKVAAVDKNGYLKAKAAGKAKITAKAGDQRLICSIRAVGKGEIEEKFYGVWKDKSGNKYECYPDGMKRMLRQILKLFGSKKYKIAAKQLSYVETDVKTMLYFRVKKGQKYLSIALAQPEKKPDILKIYIGSGVFSDDMQRQKIFLSKDKSRTSGRYIFLGDSRFVGMSYNECGQKDVYLAKVSQGLRWFMEQKSKIKQYDSASNVFIIGFGVNDLYNVNRYVDYVNKLHLHGKVYFCTVTPVDETLGKRYGYTVTNRQIQEFNKVIKKNAEKYEVLETFRALMKSGFSTTDGIHYTGSTYSKLYKYIRSNVSPW